MILPAYYEQIVNSLKEDLNGLCGILRVTFSKECGQHSGITYANDRIILSDMPYLFGLLKNLLDNNHGIELYKDIRFFGGREEHEYLFFLDLDNLEFNQFSAKEMLDIPRKMV